MIENIENLILDHLCAIRGDTASRQDGMDELKARMSNLESAMIAVKRQISIGDEVDARQQVFLDLIIRRLDRIERCLDRQDNQRRYDAGVVRGLMLP